MSERIQAVPARGRTRTLSVFFLAAVAPAFLCVVPPVRAAGTERFTIYLSPKGSDRNPGTAERPLATLQRAHAILEERRPEADVVIKVRSDAGPYVDQSVLWTYYHPAHTITIESEPASLNATFVASDDPAVRTFFGLSAMRGEPTNIILRRLTVRNYINRGVLFMGDRDVRAHWNGSNAIEHCVFERIGNARFPERQIAYSAVGLVNSRNNRIVGCTFLDIKNHTLANYPQPGPEKPLVGNPSGEDASKAWTGTSSNPNLPIVCIYLSHYSDSNVVESCTFRRIKGDVVRIRDASNDNRIVRNYFEIAGWNALVTTWYCSEPRQMCTKEFEPEAPSRGNVIAGNRAAGNWKCGVPRLYYDMTPPKGSQGRPPDPKVMKLENNVLDSYPPHTPSNRNTSA